MHKFFEENTQERKNKGTLHAFHLGVLLSHTYHQQMCAPANVMSQLLKCENVSKNAQCFSVRAYPNQDANTWGQKRARQEQTRVSKEQRPQFIVTGRKPSFIRDEPS
eukprot:1149845-Pelagomonas_calceolata.AAC.1